MAKSITLVQVGTPTGFTATLQAGGALPSGTTYYYRIISVRRWNNCNAYSVPSAEVTVTTSAGNQQVQLDWTMAANASAVIIQRTTTSGSYPLGYAGVCSPYGVGGYTQYPFAWVGYTQLIDAGGTTAGDVTFMGQPIDFSKEYPIIYLTSDANDTIKMQDVYLADVAGGWGLVDKIVSDQFKTITIAGITDELPYSSDATIYVSACKFALNGMLLFKQGCLTCSRTATFQYGSGDGVGATMPYIFTNPPFTIYSWDGTTAGNWPNRLQELVGSSSSYAYNLIKRPILRKTAISPYIISTWDDGVEATGATLKKCNIGLGAGNGMPARSATYEDIMFEGMRHNYENGDIPDCTVRWASEGLSHRWSSQVSFTRPRTTKCDYDLTMGHTAGALNIDPSYGAVGQTDNQPYIASGNSSSTYIGNTLVIGFTITLNIIDANGTPISGATVVINDKNGYSDLWVASGATATASLTTTATSLSVSDGTKFTIGDVIRVRNYAERYTITNIVGNTLTITRAAQGTTARVKAYGELSVYKQIASLTTNANGAATPTIFLISRELACAKDGGSYFQVGWESSLVTAGWISRNYSTPHTITVTKSGYQTKTMVLTMDRKREEVVVLEEAVKFITAGGDPLLWNLSATDGQNKHKWVKV